MAVTIDGTTGITSPAGTFSGTVQGVAGTFSGAVQGTTGTFSGAVQASGVATNLYPLVSDTAQLSTSGTSIDFSNIPSWAKRITVMFNNVSKNGTASILIQAVTSSFVIQSGYTGAGSSLGGTAATTAYTTGFGIRALAAADVVSGVVQLSLCDTGVINPNNWIASGVLANTASAVTFTTAGGISLGQPLVGVRVTTSTGTDVFDLGSINIFYE
jgi:hypothetical protein